MGTMQTASPASTVADRLWGAYAPFRRGRDTDRDLTAMLAVLLLAGFVDSSDGLEDELTKRWSRANAEARTGYPPLRDLSTAFRIAARHEGFPAGATQDLEKVLVDSGDATNLPWTAGFLTALQGPPGAVEAGIAEVSSLLVERYFTESDTRTGEFYTPREITQLLAATLSPQPGDRVLDPACGTGGFLVAAAQHIAEQGRVADSSFEGYAMDHRNLQVASLNLAVNGIDQPVVRGSDPQSMFQSLSSGMADFVLSNPPFNQRVQNLETLANWPFAAPPASNANFAWLQFAYARLSKRGKAALLMPTGAASARGREAAVRKHMVAGDALLAVVALPANLFSHTTVPVHLWLLARDKKHHLPAADADSILFIDASRLGTETAQQTRVLGHAARERIVGRFQAWLRSPRSTPDEPGFSCSVRHSDVLANDGFPLDPRLYVAPAREQSPAASDMRRLLDELLRQAQATPHAASRLTRSLEVSERVAHNAAEAPRVLLRDLLDKARQEGAEAADSCVLLAGPSGSLIRADHYVDDEGGVPVVMPRDLTGNGFSTASIRRISEQQAAELDRFRLRDGDVVLARRGELGRAAVAREDQLGWVWGTGCFVLRPPSALDSDYFAAYLRTPEARAWLEAHSTGSMRMQTISLKVLSDLPVVLPDLTTQRSIADAVGQLDYHQRHLQEQLDLTQRIRQGALGGGIMPTPS